MAGLNNLEKRKIPCSSQ